jgi:hypothetical protein
MLSHLRSTTLRHSRPQSTLQQHSIVSAQLRIASFAAKKKS